jgi:tRNA dimethylallyltransferase
MDNKLISVLGTTASGKTQLAVNLAAIIGGEIISADSRQVYRGMDIGSGKDLAEYEVNGLKIPYHLIDVVDAGYEYNVYEYQKDFFTAYELIAQHQNIPILCGGTGMYIESILKGYQLMKVPRDEALRIRLEKKTDEELKKMVIESRTPHNTSDLDDKSRSIRALEIDAYYREHPELLKEVPKIKSINFGIRFERNEIRNRITQRLDSRLQIGLIEEVTQLLNSGLEPEKLMFYGLEYRLVTQYITGQIDYNTMFSELNTAIHQFAKRQETWWRKMEKSGTKILWIDGKIDLNDKLTFMISKLR